MRNKWRWKHSIKCLHKQHVYIYIEYEYKYTSLHIACEFARLCLCEHISFFLRHNELISSLFSCPLLRHYFLSCKVLFCCCWLIHVDVAILWTIWCSHFGKQVQAFDKINSPFIRLQTVKYTIYLWLVQVCINATIPNSTFTVALLTPYLWDLS